MYVPQQEEAITSVTCMKLEMYSNDNKQVQLCFKMLRQGVRISTLQDPSGPIRTTSGTHQDPSGPRQDRGNSKRVQAFSYLVQVNTSTLVFTYTSEL